MANCEVKTIEREVLTVVEEKAYVLTLNQEEAELIKSILGICAGPYEPIWDVYRSLENVGVNSKHVLIKSESSKTENNVLSYLYITGLGELKE